MDVLLENLFDFPGSGEKEADKARKGAKVSPGGLCGHPRKPDIALLARPSRR